MKTLFVISFFIVLVSCARQKEKKITLQDIEQDYSSPKQSKSVQPPITKAPSPTQFGFVPVRTAANYAQQDAPPAYVKQYNQYAAGKSQYASDVQYTSQPEYSSQAQYTTQLQYATQPQYSSPQEFVTQPQYTSQPDLSQYSTLAYSGDSTSSKYLTEASSTVASLPKYTQVKYVSQPGGKYAQNDYANYQNLQYVTDNSIAQPQVQVQAEQQYYSPQYLYLQQYQAPSTSVQTVVNQKGGLQYVMYIPTYVPSTSTAQDTQTYEDVSSKSGVTSTNYQTPQTSQYSSNVQFQQTYQPAQYVQPEAKYVQEYIIKKEPKSLLDSYVPSYLQVQNYNKQYQQNYVQEPLVKIPRKTSYKSVTVLPAESNQGYSFLSSPYKYKS